MVPQPPEYLIKFCDAATAKAVLSTGTLRGSAPHLFADPFELDYESTINFDSARLLQAAVKTGASMIFGRDEPKGNSPLINAIRRWRDEERFDSPEEAEKVLEDLMAQMVDTRSEAMETLLRDWRNYALQVRICCFCSKPENPRAWQQFADNHTGIALRINVGEESDFPAPQKVLYRTERPEITSLKEQLAAVLLGQETRAQEGFQEKLLTKSKACSDEVEWRSFWMSTDASGGAASLYDDKKIAPSSIKGIYFGVLTPEQTKAEIVHLVKTRYKNIKLFQAKKATGKFEIDFDRLGGK